MDYLKHYQPRPGFTKISAIGDGGIQLTEFGLVQLAQGAAYAGNTEACETVLLILGGRCSIRGAGFDFAGLGKRTDVFSGKPHTVYIPRGREYRIEADTDVELAWIAAPSDLDTEAYAITPEQVKAAHIGRDNYQRDAHLVLTDEFPSAHLFIGEALVPSGNHASYPPHRHDNDNLPVEVDMEEIYFFRFNPEQGYGIQKLYTDDRSVDFTCTVEQNDTTLLSVGYHPVINTPGYTMYYLWIMAGRRNRKFLSVMDPQHAWVASK
ncbi:MAG: 5-deoxy-glucuronate isomerase [Kiritimatiellia bacterium]